jgi:TM2 domain-containing membrane protein YozV
MENEKKPERYLAMAVWSWLIPGLGQMIKGDTTKGILILIGYILSIASMFILIGFVLAPALVIWNIYDAYTAPRVN